MRCFGQHLRQRRMKVSAPALNEGPMLHIDIPTLEEFKALAQIKGETCVSLYLPTSPLGTNAKVSRTAFKDLAKEALSQLRKPAPTRAKSPFSRSGSIISRELTRTFRTKTRSESASAQSLTRSRAAGTLRR